MAILTSHVFATSMSNCSREQRKSRLPVKAFPTTNSRSVSTIMEDVLGGRFKIVDGHIMFADLT